MKKILLAIIAILGSFTAGFAQSNRSEFAGNDVPSQEQQADENIPTLCSFSMSAGESRSAAPLALSPGATIKKNYVATKIYNYKSGTGNNVAYSKIQYFDGMGAPTEVTLAGYTPKNQDLVSLYEKDLTQREVRSWLSIPTANRSYILLDELKNLATQYYGNTQPYARTVYHADPLNRPLTQALPGADAWGPNKTTRFDYGLNADQEVRQIIVSNLSDGVRMDVSTYYPAKTLSIVGTTNADGGITRMYMDKAGHLVMSSTGNAKTYYGYDERGRLAVIITPEAAQSLGSELISSVPAVDDPKNIRMNSAFVKGYCYYYRYDGHGNLIERRFPGGTLEEMEYNDKDQLVTRFRGKVAVSGTAESADRYLYDAVGRVTEVRLITYAINNGKRAESMDAPVSMAKYQYDDYTNVPDELTYRVFQGFSEAVIDAYRTAGLKTYEKIRVINELDRTAGYIERAFYYDTEGRLLQTVEKNHWGGISYFTNLYDYLGNLVYRQERVQVQSGAPQDIYVQQFTYDHVGRLLTKTVTFKNSDPVTITYAYNELGQLQRKNINGLIEDYTYNMQGWLTSQDSPYYSSKLKYYDGANPSYTGNITEWNWGGAGTMPHTYKYKYDGLSRMTEARYSGEATDKYSEKGIEYDRNGNILKMDRGLTEHLDYFYQNGRLQSVNNKSFTYDNCGNVIRDNRSGLDIAYNFLNLPKQIKSTKDNTVINYNYLADGRKFSALDANKTGLIYIGSLVYRMTGGTAVQFESAGFGDGCFRKNTLYVGGTYVPVYYLKDHLGSPRALCDHTGELMSLRDYYAFGKSWDKPNAPATSDSHYYNGKEEQNVAGSKLLDYGSRLYNPDIARWLSVDPQADEYFGISPYVYCANNPILFIDPNGEIIKVYDPESGVYYKWKFINNQWGFYDDNNNPYEGHDRFILDLISAINFLMKGIDGPDNGGALGGGDRVGYKLIADLATREEELEITRHSSKNRFVKPGKESSAGIWWASEVEKLMPTTNGVETTPAAISLGHELAHTQDFFNGTMDDRVWITKQYLDANNIKADDHIYNREKYATYVENQLRAENGLPLRTHYAIAPDGQTGFKPTAILGPDNISLWEKKYGKKN